MKKVVKLFSLIAVLLLAFTFTGCAKEKEQYDTRELLVDTIVLGEIVEDGYTFVGYYVQDEKVGTLYLPGAVAPKGTYEIVTVKNEKIADGVYSYPNMVQDGLTFAGWYATANYQNGTRVAASSTNVADHILYARYITIADAGLVALVCIIIVFSMLALLWAIVAMFKYVAPKEDTKPAAVKAAPAPVAVAPRKAITMEDIKDEDMMAAALVATIDYHNETGEDVRVVSIKQIG